MRVHLVNPSHLAFGVAVITPRWLYVLAAATPASYGDPVITDETLEPLDLDAIAAGDVVGIGIHTGNALRGYEIGRLARARGAHVVFGGIHATLFPEEAHELGGAHAVVKGDGDVVWGRVIDDCAAGTPERDLRRRPRRRRAPVEGALGPAAPRIATCGPRCRPCAAARSTARSARCGGPTARSRACAPPTRSIEEIVELRRKGFRFIALADDNFYPVTLNDLQMADRRADKTRLRPARRRFATSASS